MSKFSQDGQKIKIEHEFDGQNYIFMMGLTNQGVPVYTDKNDAEISSDNNNPVKKAFDDLQESFKLNQYNNKAYSDAYNALGDKTNFAPVATQKPATEIKLLDNGSITITQGKDLYFARMTNDGPVFSRDLPGLDVVDNAEEIKKIQQMIAPKKDEFDNLYKQLPVSYDEINIPGLPESGVIPAQPSNPAQPRNYVELLPDDPAQPAPVQPAPSPASAAPATPASPITDESQSNVIGVKVDDKQYFAVRTDRGGVRYEDISNQPVTDPAKIEGIEDVIAEHADEFNALYSKLPEPPHVDFDYGQDDQGKTFVQIDIGDEGFRAYVGNDGKPSFTDDDGQPCRDMFKIEDAMKEHGTVFAAIYNDLPDYKALQAAPPAASAPQGTAGQDQPATPAGHEDHPAASAAEAHHAPAYQHDPELVKDAQRFAFFAKAGGFEKLQNVTISNIDGIPGNKTAWSLSDMLDRGNPKNLGRIEKEIDNLDSKIFHDEAFSSAVIDGLRANAKTNPDQVTAFLKSRGLENLGPDLDENINNYAISIGAVSKLTQQFNANSGAAPALSTPQVSAASDMIRPDKAGLVFAEQENHNELVRDAAHKDGKWKFTKEGPEQTKGISTENVRDNGWFESNVDKEWAESVKNDPDKASLGALSLDEGSGRITYTRVDPQQGLMRVDVTDYIKENGVSKAGFDNVPFMMKNDGENDLGAALGQLDKMSDRFNAKDGMIVNIDRQTSAMGYEEEKQTDVKFGVHVYQDEAGQTQMRLVGEHTDQGVKLRAEKQTPAAIANVIANAGVDGFGTTVSDLGDAEKVQSLIEDKGWTIPETEDPAAGQPANRAASMAAP